MELETPLLALIGFIESLILKCLIFQCTTSSISTKSIWSENIMESLAN